MNVFRLVIAEICDVSVIQVLSCFQSCNASKIITEVRVSMISVVVSVVRVMSISHKSLSPLVNTAENV